MTATSVDLLGALLTTGDPNSTMLGTLNVTGWQGVNNTLYTNTTYSNITASNSTNLPTVIEDTGLHRFSAWYQTKHGYVSVSVCVVGIIANIMNVVVLTQKNMITSTNYILTALAVADMLTMVSYLPMAVYFYCIAVPDPAYQHPMGVVIYLLFSNKFVVTFHTIAMWLTVALAVFRYIVVCHHVLGPKLCNLYRAKVTILAVFIVTILFCVPNYIMHEVYPLPTGGYWFRQCSYVTTFHETFNFWVFGVVLKVAPCVLLTVLSTLLIRAMQEADRKRRRLKSQGKRAECERTSEHNRTTAMLVAVVLCFVITELPQGILAFLSGVDNRLFEYIYVPLGDMMDIIVLINSAVNFILYCIMSRQFRETFKDVFLKYCQRTVSKTPNGVHYTNIATKNTGSTKM